MRIPVRAPNTTSYNPGMTNRKRQFGAWVVGTVAALPILYVLSFGPACWWFASKCAYGRVRCAPKSYWPIGVLAHNTRSWFPFRIISWYATLDDRPVVVPTDSAGTLNLDAVVIFYP